MPRQRHRAAARDKATSFVMITNNMIDSPAYTGLSSKARSALVELMRVYNGHNNGRLAMPIRRLSDRLGVSKDTASRALTELEDSGFIKTVQPSKYKKGERLAAEYRLMHLRCDVSHQNPDRTFLNWPNDFRARQAEVRKNAEPGPKIPPVVASDE